MKVGKERRRGEKGSYALSRSSLGSITGARRALLKTIVVRVCTVL